LDKEKINTKVDILVFGAHPDDIELACSGTILKHLELGYKIGLIDLTQGELGTRGNKETRQLETKKANSLMRQLLGLHNIKLTKGALQGEFYYD